MKSRGSVMLFFLIVMTVLVAIAALGFRTAVMLTMSSRMRMIRHQQINLVEGLMKYGIALCKANKKILRNGECKSFQLAFDPWPSPETVAILGHYKGMIAIVCTETNSTIDVQLLRDNQLTLSGQAILARTDLKNSEAPLIVVSWKNA